MKTILIPIDFSAASHNAIQYTSSLICNLEVERVILLNSFHVSIYAQLLPSADFVQLTSEDIQQQRHQVETELQEVGEAFHQHCDASIQVITRMSEHPITRAIHDTIEQEQVHLLILGSDDQNKSNESLVGRQLIAIAKSSPIAVLIIPSDVQYQKIERALVPCNFGTINNLKLLKDFHHAERWLQAELLVLNVNPQESRIWADEDNLNSVKEMLQDYDYKLYNSENRNTLQGILDFSEAHDVHLIVALPGKHSFFYNLTHLNITEAITLNSRQPVLLLKS